MSRKLAAFALAALLAPAAGFAQQGGALGEVEQHLLTPAPIVRTPWRETTGLVEQTYDAGWTARIVVNESGAVSSASIASGPQTQRSEAERAARALRFRPFTSNGRPVSVELEMFVEAQPVDYSGPPDRTFPRSNDLADVRIRLERTGCPGQCPAYTVDVAGDGSVVYVGGAATLIQGERRWRVPQANVTALLDLFRRADYFKLRGYYQVRAADLPTYVTALQIGPRRKFVLDYGRSGGAAVASAIPPGDSDQILAPPSVVEIEDAIDRLSGADAFAKGTLATVEALRRQRWSFGSDEAGRALARLTAACNVTVARAFLEQGAPADIGTEGPQRRGSYAIETAPRCGDAALVRELIRRDAVKNRAMAEALLRASAASGIPGMVEAALRESRAVHQRGKADGETLLIAALRSAAPEQGEPGFADFNRAATVSLLLAAGADARIVDNERESPLHVADDGAAARALLIAGADPNARNARGRTPLFEKNDAATVRLLLESRADPNARDLFGQTPLFSAYNAEVVQALVAGGADVNARDSNGRTPLDNAQNEGAALALIAAGAQLPGDQERLTALIERARNLNWTRLLPALLRRARPS
jgi:hypothetical protein